MSVSVSLLLHGGQGSQSIWHWKLVTKGLSTVFNVLWIFILLLTVSTGLDLSHLGGWVDRRRCPPRPRARIGLAGLGPIKSVYLDIMVYFSTWLNKLYKARVGIRLVKLL